MNLKEIFKNIDSNRDGLINLKEFSNFIRGLDNGIKTEDIHHIFRDFDYSKHENINYEEFYYGIQ